MNRIFKQFLGILTAIAISSCGSLCTAQETNTSRTDITEPFPFPVGEELIYEIYWGIVPVGTTTIKTEWVEVKGSKLLAIRYKSHTNRIFGTIYPIDDTAESIINPDTFLPITFNFCIIRRSSRTEKNVTFDHVSLKAEMITLSTGATNVLDISHDTRDIVTFLYHLRSADISTNKTIQDVIVTDTGLLDMKINSYNYENIKLGIFGKVSCLKMEPITKLDSLLVEDGKVMTWVAKERRLATMMTIKAPLANVTTKLVEVRGPGTDFWSEKMKKKKDEKAEDTQPVITAE